MCKDTLLGKCHWPVALFYTSGNITGCWVAQGADEIKRFLRVFCGVWVFGLLVLF